MEIGVCMAPRPRRSAETARMLEEGGFATLLLPDSQNMAPDVWIHLALAARATSRIRLATGVTNPVTRDVAVTASAALTLQVESDGRAICGVGRGDSSLQRLGRKPVRAAEFERYLQTLQTYLGGGSVDREGFASRLEWLAAVEAPKVPVEVAATGPRVIALAARHADRIAFAVGADPDRLAWAIEVARGAARDAGRDPTTLRLGTYVSCAIHPDPAIARDAVRGTVATFARFSGLAGADVSHLPPALRDAATYLRRHYDMREHTRATADHARALEDGFVDWYAVAGPLDSVLPRLRRLAALGLDFCHVVPGSTSMARGVATGSLRALARDVIPALSAPAPLA